ncbi:hypothetical protein Y1Q_0006039 [Alligator mississippiensis]|uniref:Uncharacterized protein n=1 Tax=Alligator mississippiensis TaxID=8496 RepID=A0A151N498_ALLMI|nr:hypothetical protein Y1Q_0006039 [Alligator mississippiensis]
MMETKLLGKLGETTQLTKGLTSRESLLEAGKLLVGLMQSPLQPMERLQCSPTVLDRGPGFIIPNASVDIV